MVYYNFQGDELQNEFDEKMTHKYGDKYRCVKNVYPDVYKLPEEEIQPMTHIIRYQGDTMEEAEDLLRKHIKKNEPMWKEMCYIGDNHDDFSEQEPKSNLIPLTDENFKERERLAKNLAPKRLNYPFEAEEDNKFMNRISPAYAAFDTASLLYDRKKEMERNNTINNDNYYHRLAMCELGQKGSQNPFYLPSAFIGGVFKEGYDFGKKTFKDKDPLLKTLRDMYKDTKNNIEGYSHGIMYPQENCDEWLQNLDINTNTWKK